MTTAKEHFENAASEYERKIEEGSTKDEAYIVALDYLEDFAPDNVTWNAALDMFIDKYGCG